MHSEIHQELVFVVTFFFFVSDDDGNVKILDLAYLY